MTSAHDADAGWITPSSGNVFLDLGFPPGEAEHLLVRTSLMSAITSLIETRGLTQARAARLFGVTQPRVSDLVRGRLELFSIDSLVEMLGRAGIGVSIRLELRSPGYRADKSALTPVVRRSRPRPRAIS